DPHHYNQALLLEVRQPLQPALLAEALRRLLAHHDALRLRFVEEAGTWRQHNAPSEEGVPFRHLDLSGVPAAEQAVAVEAACAEAQASLDLAHGPLLRVVYFDSGPGQPGRLLLVIHHLAVDGVSWRVLLEDLLTAYQQLQKGRAPQLPPKTTSFRQWATRLVDYARSAEVRREAAFWLARPPPQE